MRTRGGVQRVAKWFTLLGCVISFAGWGLTSGRWVEYAGRVFGVAGIDGVFYVWLGDRRPPSGVVSFLISSSDNIFVEPWPRIGRDSRGCMVACIQSWWVGMTAALISGFLWWRDRGFPPGHCQTCGYNLTGNVSGLCPECGATIGRAGAAAPRRRA